MLRLFNRTTRINRYQITRNLSNTIKRNKIIKHNYFNNKAIYNIKKYSIMQKFKTMTHNIDNLTICEMLYCCLLVHCFMFISNVLCELTLLLTFLCFVDRGINWDFLKANDYIGNFKNNTKEHGEDTKGPQENHPSGQLN